MVRVRVRNRARVRVRVSEHRILRDLGLVLGPDPYHTLLAL